jgi:hypothetical protein
MPIHPYNRTRKWWYLARASRELIVAAGAVSTTLEAGRGAGRVHQLHRAVHATIVACHPGRLERDY